MPELPEVETTRRGISPYLEGSKIKKIIIRNRSLRWPIPSELEKKLQNQIIISLNRRGKYLLLETSVGTAIIHLGMSGSIRIVDNDLIPEKHDHFEIITSKNIIARYNDPRRFGCFLWAGKKPENHPLLINLGPEPLDSKFTSNYLYKSTRGKRTPIKQHIMNSRNVVGIGNIYANEALFYAGIDPNRIAGRISEKRISKLVDEIIAVLKKAIKEGGTTLRNYRGGNGMPGYFKQELAVYERENLKCKKCDSLIKRRVLAQRSTYFCRTCQK
ncbi:MAG: bifunctional DNA-formamidopyrimidine glycosylase/DNA-(apurinic or apyrimidinic site) lyase [Pseudomonadota bacterium]|nr:bifunctional DNA-formamidopyrimidine glycosylase/DNA-(apurinic or apyrimidinic site) lyase [Pseudomonadota bacterium]